MNSKKKFYTGSALLTIAFLSTTTLTPALADSGLADKDFSIKARNTEHGQSSVKRNAQTAKGNDSPGTPKEDEEEIAQASMTFSMDSNLCSTPELLILDIDSKASLINETTKESTPLKPHTTVPVTGSNTWTIKGENPSAQLTFTNMKSCITSIDAWDARNAGTTKKLVEKYEKDLANYNSLIETYDTLIEDYTIKSQAYSDKLNEVIPEILASEFYTKLMEDIESGAVKPEDANDLLMKHIADTYNLVAPQYPGDRPSKPKAPLVQDSIDLTSMFQNMTNLKSVVAPPYPISKASHAFQGSSIETLSGEWVFAPNSIADFMFRETTKFNTDLPDWNTSGLTSIAGMFQNSVFNSDISTWDTSNVTNMNFMFWNNTNFNQPIGEWNTGKVESTTDMFRGATNFNQPIGQWDTSSLTDARHMFASTENFNQDLSQWNVENLENASYMFSRTVHFNSDISPWKTSNITKAAGMFFAAYRFDQDLSQWDLNKVNDDISLFASGSPISDTNKMPKFK